MADRDWPLDGPLGSLYASNTPWNPPVTPPYYTLTYPFATTANTHVTSLTLAPMVPEDEFAWLRRRVREITELCPH